MKNAILFLDGEYWGFYLIEEKIDDHFLSNNYLIPNDFIVVVKANKIDDGPEEEFNDFNSFCDKYSLEDVSKEDVYSEIKKKIDIDSFIELYATGVYIMHFDWPGNNDGSWKYYGDPIDGNKYSDGRWRFIIFDLDYSMGGDFFNPYVPDFDMFAYIESRGRGNGRWKSSSTTLFINLIKNNVDFQNKFVNTVCDSVNNVYTKEKVESLVNKYKNECGDIVAASKLRWNGYQFYSVFEGISYYKTNFFKSLDAMKEFYENRPNNIFQNMKEYMGLKGEPVDLEIEIIGRGKVQINSIIPNYLKGYWTGKYFTRIPIAIKAIPEEGYKFRKWTGYFESSKENEEIVLLESQKITVIFD